MPEQARKLSEIMKEMSETLLRNPGGVPSSEAAHVALLFANVAWNESLGIDVARVGYRNGWETIEAENPATSVLERVEHCSLLHIVRVEVLSPAGSGAG